MLEGCMIFRAKNGQNRTKRSYCSFSKLRWRRRRWPWREKIIFRYKAGGNMLVGGRGGLGGGAPSLYFQQMVLENS